MRPKLNLLPTAIVHPSNIVLYNQVIWDPCKPSRKKDSLSLDCDINKNSKFLHSERKANGNVSDIAERKIKKAIDYLVTTSTEKNVRIRRTGKNIKFKIAFITLTLPSKQLHSDKEIIHKCLNSLLIELMKSYHVHNYVWRAEKQKNGNLHFHLLINKFVPWSELRDRWNRIVNKLNYVDNYRSFLKKWHENGFKVRKDLLSKWDEQAQLLAYQKGKASDFNNPNSIDIHSVKKIKNIRAYLTKYLTKNEKNENTNENEQNDLQKQTGRIWGCNHELSNIKGYKCEVDNETELELKNLVQSGRIRSFKSEYFTVLTVDYRELISLGAKHLFEYFCNYLFERFNYSEQLRIA